MPIRYVFTEQVRVLRDADKADPQVIGEALEKISAENSGELTPKAVVDKARAPRHALHKHFEWDDQVAAEAHRMDQARNLIRAIHVEAPADSGQATMRAFLSVRQASGTAYHTVESVLKSKDLQQRVLAAAEKDLVAFERRYAALLDVCDLVRQARERLAERSRRGAGDDSRPHAPA